MSKRKVHVLERSQRVRVSIDQVFAFFSQAENLEKVTPPWLHFQLLTPTPVEMRAGTLLDYRLRLHQVPVRWRTRIEVWEPPTNFRDIQLRGPYALWDHSHSFERDGDGAVIMHDRVRYAMPLGALGQLAHAAFVKRDLERIFDYRQQGAERWLRPAPAAG
jgi:ligand-binding SRPBCC domain-containing protein